MEEARAGATRLRPDARLKLRKRIRFGSLVAGLAMVLAAGSAQVPGLAPDSVAGPAPALVATASPAPLAAAESPEVYADFARADRASRGERPPLWPLPEPEPSSPAPSPEPEPEPAPPVVAGIPQPCSIDLPITSGASAAEIADHAEQQWDLRLSGPQWRNDEYRSVVQLFAETLDAVDCTGYLDRVKEGNGGDLEVSSQPTRSWSWGDYGLTRAHVITLDFDKFRQGYADGDRGRLVRLVVHEMAHALNADRRSDPAYWRSFNQVWNAKGPVSAYGSTQTESFADAVGYYVARCAADNPYAGTEHAEYYDYVKSSIFDGREFGSAVGTDQQCVIQGR